MKNRIGLNTKESKILAKKLNILLSNYQLFYMNTRGFHWNIKGRKFFELHLKFEEIYNDLLLKIDEVAERILTLEEIPMHTFSDYLSNTEIKESKNISDGNLAMESILDSYQILILKQRGILSFASNIDDEGTSALMSDYIREQEKTIWMLSSFLS